MNRVIFYVMSAKGHIRQSASKRCVGYWLKQSVDIPQVSHIIRDKLGL